jgi:hypothetical protein
MDGGGIKGTATAGVGTRGGFGSRREWVRMECRMPSDAAGLPAPAPAPPPSRKREAAAATEKRLEETRNSNAANKKGTL